jgi:hypothetical protein
MRAIYLQQFTKLLYRQAGVTSDTAHSERVDRIVAWYGQDTLTVAHYDVLALTHNLESRLFQCAHGVEVIYIRELGQG